MSNYLYTHTILDERKGEICGWSDYQNIHLKHHQYIRDYIAPAVKAAKCGWDDVKYILVKYPNSTYRYPYMVLCVDDHPARWIPVDGNSDGCNLQVIGENLW